MDTLLGIGLGILFFAAIEVVGTVLWVIGLYFLSNPGLLAERIKEEAAVARYERATS